MALYAGATLFPQQIGMAATLITMNGKEDHFSL
jgi:hypothetical protein